MTGLGFESYLHSQQVLQAAAAASSDDLNTSTVSADGNDQGGDSTTGSNTTAAGSSLLAILASLRSRFAKSKRREILLRAREVVLADYHNTMLATGDALEVSHSVNFIHIYLHYIIL